VHACVLATITGERDVLTGIITNGRIDGPDGDRVLGVFLNTMPLRLTVGDGTWLDLLRDVFEVERGALPYRRFPFAELQRLNGGRPPFEAAINVINFHVYDRLRGIKELELLDRSTSYDQTFFPLTGYFELDVFSSSLMVHLDVNAPDLGDDQIRTIGGYYLRALEALAADPHARVHDSPLVGDEERRLLVALNDTATVDQAVCVHELLERQAARRPTAMAVRAARASLTYADLNAQANRLARYLRAHGVRNDDLVGLCVERDERALAAIFGIMKAGAAYVPLDPAFPPDRLKQTKEDADLSVIVTLSSLVDRVPGEALRVCLDADAAALAREASENLGLAIDPESRIYVIYTSGSTGRPKGVEVPHRAVVNLTASFERELAFTDADVMPAIATFSFDMSILELYLQFRAGACLVVVERETASDAERLAETIRATGITVMQATPSMWRMLLDSGWRGSRRLRAMTGGEALPRELATRLKERCPRLRNVYGPTETTCWSMSAAVPEDGAITIGKPIANTQVYVLDDRMQPHAIGVPGRLFIGGRGVARGYLRRPVLTASRFVPDPFSSEPGARLYDTGDRARYLPDGTVDFLGRADDQIKVRGFRIELGEIEATLVQYPGVRQAAVVAQEYAAGDVRLIASLVCAPDAVPAWSDLRRFLLSKLPDYMVPVGFVALDALPLTHNGKINRQALARLTRIEPAAAEAYEAPRTPLERQLASIWSDVLHVSEVGLRDSFFGLGGHSLLAMQVVSRVRARLAPQLPLSALFEAPTLAQFADTIERLGARVDG
jgi:amino acid adenylation domain-containing protein